ncbi:uncharacterized protein TA15130 [Theileria annulata]|uniref:Uncharacterized protein n=1 Tax=Theileria annulata TaxID=5874 RepID=Q4UFC1_THEAN|nr:uncharacterized protein TA15130 [Theileria annulata]CAI74195.1 hypothetical protein TA15130 [Theileria annulata]|eukprot:XP_951927.1 hypothetical protein TA15130 [Theileria annulata]
MLTTNKEIIKLILYNFILDPMIKWDNIQNKITLKLTNHINIFTTSSTTNSSTVSIKDPYSTSNMKNIIGNNMEYKTGNGGLEVIYINEKVYSSISYSSNTTTDTRGTGNKDITKVSSVSGTVGPSTVTDEYQCIYNILN